jgi:hypothetical protein
MMCDTTLEKDDLSSDVKMDVEAKIKRELLSILTNVEILTETMSRVISKEEDRRRQFKALCSAIDHIFNENIEVIERNKNGIKEIDPSLHLIACKLSTKMVKLRNVAIKPDLKSMKTGMRKVLSQQRTESFQTNPRQEEQRPQKG